MVNKGIVESNFGIWFCSRKRVIFIDKAKGNSRFVSQSIFVEIKVFDILLLFCLFWEFSCYYSGKKNRERKWHIVELCTSSQFGRYQNDSWVETKIAVFFLSSIQSKCIQSIGKMSIDADKHIIIIHATKSKSIHIQRYFDFLLKCSLIDWFLGSVPCDFSL